MVTSEKRATGDLANIHINTPRPHIIGSVCSHEPLCRPPHYLTTSRNSRASVNCSSSDPIPTLYTAARIWSVSAVRRPPLSLKAARGVSENASQVSGALFSVCVVFDTLPLGLWEPFPSCLCRVYIASAMWFISKLTHRAAVLLRLRRTPPRKSPAHLSSMADQEEDYSTLPLPDRFQHKVLDLPRKLDIGLTSLDLESSERWL